MSSVATIAGSRRLSPDQVSVGKSAPLVRALLCMIAAGLSGCGPDRNGEGHIVSASGDKATRYLLYSDGQEIDLKAPSAIEAFRPATGAFQAQVSAGTVTWNVEYADVTAHSGIGFDDAQTGSERRSAFEASLAAIGRKLNLERPGTLDVIVQPSLNDPTDGMLAKAGTFYPDVAVGFFTGHALSRLTIGFDPDPRPDKLDVAVTVNFGHPYHLGDGPPPPTLQDFRSLTLHEVTHALGFLSYASRNGTSGNSGANPGKFTSYDTHLQRADGTPLFVGSGRFIGTPVDLSGPAGGLHWAGEEVAKAECGGRALVFAPNPYQPGSSLSHIEPADSSTVMQWTSMRGRANRDYVRTERAMLRDLGLPFLGLTQATGPTYCPKADFPTSGFVRAVQIASVDDQPGRDLVMVEQDLSGAKLVIFSGLDPTRRYSFALPDPMYVDLATGEFGPDSVPGIMVADSANESVFTLAGLKLPEGRTILSAADFSHLHKAAGPASAPGPAGLNSDPAIAIGNLDDRDGRDVLTFSSKLGLIPFLEDGRGQFDGLRPARDLYQLDQPFAPSFDLSPYRHGGPLTFDIPFGLGGTNASIASVTEAGNLTSQRVLPSDPHRIEILERGGLVAIAGTRNVTSNDFDLVRTRVAAGGTFSIEQRWDDVGRIGDVSLDLLYQVGFATDTDRHRILRASMTGPQIETLAGSVSGFRDGPLNQALFAQPTALCQSNRTLYVIDSGNKLVRSIDLDRLSVTTLAGKQGVSGTVDGPRDRATFQFASSNLTRHACAVIGESLYLFDGFDAAGRPDRLRKVNLRNGRVSTLEYFGYGDVVTGLSSEGGSLYLLKGENPRRLIQAYDRPTPSSFALPSPLVRLADLTGDGFDDAIAMPDPMHGYRTLYSYENMRDGNLRLKWNQTFDVNPVNAELADLDSDGKVDLIAVFPNQVRFLKGDGSGQFAEDFSWRLTLDRPLSFARLSELNGTGPQDLAVLDTSGRLLIFYTDAAGGWAGGAGVSGASRVSEIPGATTFSWFDLSDEDGDGLPELVGYASSGKGARLYEARLR